MAGVVNRLKFVFSADTQEFRKQTNEGKAAVQTFAREGKSAMDRFASAFGINTRAVGEGLKTFNQSAAALGKGFSGAAKGSNILSASLKLLKVAIISTGIGALVIALGALVAYFTKTQRGADKVRLVMESFKAIINVLIDRLASFGEGIFLIFTGKFKQGAEQLGAAFKGVGEEIKEEAKEAWNLEKRWQALQDQEIAMMGVISEHRRKFDELRLAAEDANNTIEQRKNLLVQASEEEKKAIAIEAEMQKERVDIMRSRIALGESTREELRELAEEEAKLNQIYERGASAQKELASQIRGLNKSLDDQSAAAVKAAKALNQIKPPEGLGSGKITVDPKELIPINTWEPQMMSLKDMYESVGLAVVDTSGSINDALGSVASGMGAWLGSMMAGQAGFRGFANLLAGTMADLAINLGKTAIGSAMAISGIKAALKTLNPGAAFAAGIGLVALGTALKAKLSSMASSPGIGGGGMGSVMSSGSSSYMYDNRVNVQPAVINVTFSGSLETDYDKLRVRLDKTGVIRRSKA